MNNLVNFLADLAVAPEKQLAFAGTPKQLLGASGLAELDRQLIERGDKDDIAIALGSELSVLAIAAADPVEDPFPDPDPSDPEPSESETE
ncbi:hypothetical protein BI308_09995 [Roseofilum reptotaenium AO1-A]|uniref:Uncharacterized protein n=1 Tax=Roseofilum reptotaenium AO1-A TaxID=1925591 RepID=A0A1L9QSU4_9CYAN|nr:hypothetical protein BI308_09995 [Roseofilum reptotaenium AO1-A]